MADKIERVYTINLSKAWETPRQKHTRRAVSIVKQFLARNMKVPLDVVRISNAVNSTLWERSIKKPPRRIKVKVIKEGESVRAYLPDEKVEEKKVEEKKAEEKKEEPKPKESTKGTPS